MDFLRTKMMATKYIALLMSIFIVNVCTGQSLLGTVFYQGGTQMDYYLQQIAALGVYTKDLKSGYKTVSNGLNTIHEAKNGEFSLHQAYFNSLSNVNPAIKRDPKVNGILTYQTEITTCFNNMFTSVSGSKQLTASEISYLKTVCNNLLTGCNNDLDELSLVITSGKVQMKDDERIKRIDKLYADMQDKYNFAQNFTAQAIVLTIQRAHQQNDVQTLQQLYQVKQ
jgi:hypothetical protein